MASVRLQATIQHVTAEHLRVLSNNKGMSKSAIIAMAIDKLWKEEYPDEK